MNFSKSHFAVFLTALIVLAFNAGPTLANSAIEPFYGNYEGQTVTESGNKRSLTLAIRPAKNKGFEIDWSTTTFSLGSGKTKTYSISFVPSGRSHIYSSAMRRNVFGKLTPMNPLKGDPFVWSRIDGNKLIVYSLLITDSGGYEMQEYVRTLNDGGLKLNFSRIRDGKPLKVITGEYRRVK